MTGTTNHCVSIDGCGSRVFTGRAAWLRMRWPEDTSGSTAKEQIEMVRGQLPFKLEAASIPARRGPAREARLCYVEDADTQQRRQVIKDSIRQDRQQMPRTPGRPDKHTRRKLRDYGRRQGDPE
jgi:hypothetical protein